MNLDLSDKVFIVTGGTDGLGFATARSLIAEGAKVLVTGRTEDKFIQAQRVLGEHADRIAFFAGSNADPDLPAHLRTAVMARWGRLDGLLVSVGGPQPGKALAITDSVWMESFERVFLGVTRLVRELSGVMTDGGAIALVLAVSAKVASPVMAISNGLRPGLAMLVKNYADELGARNIRVNALLPGMFATDRVKQLFVDSEPDFSLQSLQRLGDPMEFGRMATLLLSPATSYVTGAAIAVDGGLLKTL